MTSKRRGCFNAIAVLLTLVALVGLGYFTMLRISAAMIADKGQREANQGVVFLADALREKQSDDGWLPRSTTPEDVLGREPDPTFPFRHGKFDYYGYTIEMEGDSPAHEGTRIKYHGKRMQGRVVLTVRNLERGEWDVVAEDAVEWWEIWK